MLMGSHASGDAVENDADRASFHKSASRARTPPGTGPKQATALAGEKGRGFASPAGTSTRRPLSEAARHIFGNGAAAAIACGALVSIYGYLGANMLHTPRLTFALAERGDFPLFFAAVHPNFRTPHLSIIVYTVLLLAFALVGNFRWNITLSAVARLLTYCSFAVALLVLRKKRPDADAFRLWGGPFIAMLTLSFCLVLFVQTPLSNLSIVLSVIAIAALNWLLVRNSDATPQSDA